MPRKKEPTQTQITRREHADSRRADVIAAGGRALYILLQPKVAKKLAKLCAQDDASALTVISSLILSA